MNAPGRGKPNTLPAHLAAVRDAAVASPPGEQASPKNLSRLFEWLFWNGDQTEFDNPFLSLDKLNLTDADLRDALDLQMGDAVTDEQRLRYAQDLIDRMLSDGEDLIYAHAFRLERKDGSFTYLCGTSWMAGQGGHQTNCDGLFPSQRHYLQWLRRSGMESEGGASLTAEKVLAHWQKSTGSGA